MTVRHLRGTADELHHLDPFTGDHPITSPVEVWWCDPVRAALVLGSRQGLDSVDEAACSARGIDVARRRSGGAAVLIVPGDVIWIDVVAVAGVLPDDVGRSMAVVGDAWAAALAPPGADAALAVHQGPMVVTEWSRRVCFAGLGPGEVTAAGRKLVGLSQRRTRHGVRIQGLVHRRSVVAETVPLLRGPLPEGPLPEVAAWPVLDPATVASTLAARLAASNREEPS